MITIPIHALFLIVAMIEYEQSNIQFNNCNIIKKIFLFLLPFSKNYLSFGFGFHKQKNRRNIKVRVPTQANNIRNGRKEK